MRLERSLKRGVKYAVSDLLPHGPAMVLLDRLVDYDDESATCEVTIRGDSAFSQQGRGVPGWVGIEYMAQTIGAYAGIVRLQSGRSVQVGLLLGSRSYDFEPPWFPAGTILTVTARLLISDAEGVAVFACELREGGRTVAVAEIKGFQPDDVGQYLDSLAGELE